MELAAATSCRHAACGLTHARQQGLHVRTIDLVATELGEDVCFLCGVASEMEPEDGLIWVQGLGEEGVMAFTDFGVETLTGLIQIYKADPHLLKRSTDPE